MCVCVCVHWYYSSLQSESLFQLLSPLVQDQADQPKEPVSCYYCSHLATFLSLSPQPDPEDFSEEQWLMAKMVHLLKAEAADQQYVVGII